MVNIKQVRGPPRSSFFLEYGRDGRHVARLRSHVCTAHAPASHAAWHDDHENSIAWFSNYLCSHEPMGLHSAALWAAVELRY